MPKTDYEEEEFESNTMSKSSTLKWVAIFAIAGLIWFLFGGKWGVQTFDTAHFDAVMLIVGMVLLESGMTYWKHKTPKIVFGGHTSHSTIYINDFKQVGRWGVARLGGTMAMGIHISGRDGTLVAPFSSYNAIGNCIVCTSKCEPTSLDKLPKGIRKYLIENKFPLPIYYGIFTEKQLKETDVAEIEEELEQSNQTTTVYENTLPKIMEINEGVLESAKRLSGKDSITEAIKKRVLENKNSESQ